MRGQGSLASSHANAASSQAKCSLVSDVDHRSRPRPTINKSSKYLVDCYRKVAHTFSSSVIDSIGDSSRNSDNTNLAHAFDSQRVNSSIRLFNEDDPDILHISVHWHMVLGDVGVHNATEIVVDQRLFMEGHADSPDHAPHDLTGGGFRIDDATGRDRVNNTRYADGAELLVHLHFGEDRRVRVARMSVVFSKFSKLFVLDAIYATVPHGIRERYRAVLVLLGGNHAIRKKDIIRLQPRERRARHLLRETQKLHTNLIGRSSNGVRHRGCGPRPALDLRMRQRRVAEFDCDVIDRHAEHVSSDLSHNRVSASADVRRGA